MKFTNEGLMPEPMELRKNPSIGQKRGESIRCTAVPLHQFIAWKINLFYSFGKGHLTFH